MHHAIHAQKSSFNPSLPISSSTSTAKSPGTDPIYGHSAQDVSEVTCRPSAGFENARYEAWGHREQEYWELNPAPPKVGRGALLSSASGGSSYRHSHTQTPAGGSVYKTQVEFQDNGHSISVEIGYDHNSSKKRQLTLVPVGESGNVFRTPNPRGQFMEMATLTVERDEKTGTMRPKVFIYDDRQPHSVNGTWHGRRHSNFKTTMTEFYPQSAK